MKKFTLPNLGTKIIFILGIAQRSGTNYLHLLLCQHPNCQGIIGEDFLLDRSNLLIDYVNNINLKTKKWAHRKGRNRLLYENIGKALLWQLDTRYDQKYFVTKTPQVNNLKYFFDLFPDAYLLILIRDGRAVIESGMKSFGWKFEQASRVWAKAAKEIIDFDRKNKKLGLNYLIIKYEDLYQNPKKELKKIFKLTGLSEKKYNYEKIDKLLILGTSEAAKGKRKFKWQGLEKSADFRPLERWESWGRAKHERFNWLAGNELTKFGNQKRRFKSHLTFWEILNKMLDIKYWLKKQIYKK